MRVLQLTIALLAVACCAWAKSSLDWQVHLTHQSSTEVHLTHQSSAEVHLTHQSSTEVRGSFSQGTSKRMNFHVFSDKDGNRALSLQRADGKNLLEADWTSSQQRLDVSRFRVMRTAMSTDLDNDMDLDNDPTTAQQKAEGKAFDEFLQTSEFKSLPILSQILGTKYNVTGYGNEAAMSFHLLAMLAERMHRTLEKQGIAPAKYTSVEKCYLGLNPWSAYSSDTFKCNSPSGKCDKLLLDYTSPDSCSYRGTPFSPDDYFNGCTGLCGPGCYHCWKRVCGDCCNHPGCFLHDNHCENSYTNFKCLTAKGVLWGRGENGKGYPRNC